MSIISINKTKEKRKYNRYFLPLEIFVNNSEYTNDIFCNISEGGVCFKSSVAYNLNDYVFLHFSSEKSFSIKNLKFSTICMIVWQEKSVEYENKYGAQFIFFNDPFSKQQKERMLTFLNFSI
ncbi:MAG: PilZ domain-containing protein [Chitinispirillia bacterium]